MDEMTGKKYKWFWVSLVAIASLALVATSFLPYFFL